MSKSSSPDKKASIVKEAAVSYTSSVPGRSVLSKAKTVVASDPIIDKNRKKPEWQMTPIEKMVLVQDGVSKQSLENLKDRSNLDYDKLAVILSTNRATLINKKGKEVFSAGLSERIVSIADIYSFGFEVFKDSEKFNDWVFRSNGAIGDKRPYDLLDNQFGREEIKNLIGRIQYGVYS